MKGLLTAFLIAFCAVSVYAARQVELTADDINIIYDGSRPREAFLEGNILVTSEDVRIRSQKGYIDYEADEASLWDDLSLESDVFSGTGRSLVYNMKTGGIKTDEEELILKPVFAREVIDSPLYVKASEISRNEDSYTSEGASVTGCDSEAPHYMLKCRSMTIFPSSRIILKAPEFFWHQKRVMGLPYMSIPLDDRYNDPRTTPKTGYSDTEGWFGKFAYPYNPSDEQFYGLLLFDVMSRKGVGLGVRQDYGDRKGSVKGQAGYYHVFNVFGEGDNTA
ncbi:MAG: hypothetical protein IJT95_05930, partial [Abditibacteriota bacterium]|nr:hypothetical protein [Abditibacteriota bacterium]